MYFGKSPKTFGIGYMLTGFTLLGVDLAVSKLMLSESKRQNVFENKYSPLSQEEFPFLKNVKIPIVYHEGYNVIPWSGFEDVHSFDGEKYGKIMRTLIKNNLIMQEEVHKPSLPDRSTLKLV